MEAVLDDDVARERTRQVAFRARLKTPGRAFGVAVSARGVRSLWGEEPGTLGVFVTRIDADDTLSKEGLHVRDGDNVDVVCSSFGRLLLAMGNAGRAGQAGAPLHKDLRGFGRDAIVTNLLKVQLNDDNSALMSSVQWSAVAVDLQTGDVIKTWRDGRIGYGLADLEALVARDGHVQPPNVVTDDDVARWLTTVVGGASSEGVLRVDEEQCVIEKIEEGARFKQARAEAAAKAEADAAADARNLAELTSAGADGGLAQTRFVLGGLPRQRGVPLNGGGEFFGRGGLYADSDALERLLRARGADVLHLGNLGRGRNDAVFTVNGLIRFCTDTRAVLVLSDGYGRDGRRPPGWLDCFRRQGRAVKESYIVALAAENFDFDSVELGPHLAYEPGTKNARAI